HVDAMGFNGRLPAIDGLELERAPLAMDLDLDRPPTDKPARAAVGEAVSIDSMEPVSGREFRFRDVRRSLTSRARSHAWTFLAGQSRGKVVCAADAESLCARVSCGFHFLEKRICCCPGCRPRTTSRLRPKR